ncbi:hypothetical protein M514_06095 [Trichuris suis]|uniref:Uncharacterized protein n=1 Tax=Trichuris suis TaxID=68888 RepID=A0A085M6Y3_9BILA|nr:hypothetical protein M513_06095 [Trichuris suis]KFD69891.1 hypothetical protein M514_06095 [Trichuris suis]
MFSQRAAGPFASQLSGAIGSTRRSELVLRFEQRKLESGVEPAVANSSLLPSLLRGVEGLWLTSDYIQPVPVADCHRSSSIDRSGCCCCLLPPARDVALRRRETKIDSVIIVACAAGYSSVSRSYHPEAKPQFFFA